jgi:hypothetical protein
VSEETIGSAMEALGMLLDREREVSTLGGRLTAAARLSDQELLGRVVRLAGDEREATVELVAHLAELDARRLYLGEGFGSLFTYCTGALRLAEHAAYNRIEAARASRRFPPLLDLLADGSMNLSTVRLLAPHLQTGNFESLVALAKGRSKREVEVLVAHLAPQPDVTASVRKLPAPSPPLTVRLERGQPTAPWPAGVPFAQGQPLAALPTELPPAAAVATTLGPAGRPPSAAPAEPSRRSGDSAHASSSDAPAPAATLSRPVVVPLAPGRYRVQFTVGEATHRRLRQAQDLLRREIPDGDPAAIFDRALALLLADVQGRKQAALRPPQRASSSGRTPAFEEAARANASAPRSAASAPEGASEGSSASAPASALASAVPRPPAVVLKRSRHIPARVRRAVWRRDGGRCAFVARNGRRCAERAFLEFHHRDPYAIGGEATLANISLRCRAHNAHEADLVFAPGGLAPGRVGPIPRGREVPPGPGSGGVSPLSTK